MAITAAEIESNGWVLRLTLTGSPGDFASYALDPDGSARLALASSHAGFVKSGGVAVPGNLARALVGTMPLRLPVDPVSPETKVIDETNLGGGSIRVRIALSDWVYATDAGVTLAAAAGWRSGEAAASAIAVTNNSTMAAPVPIMRWVLPSYDVATGSFRLSLIVGSHHPVGFEPVAGVKFTATDGVTVKTAWAMALDTDNSFGDGLRCHTVMIDPATATALAAGLLRCDAEVYPWLGSMRSTDPAGTRSMAGLATAGLNSSAQTPFVIGYDPAGTRYSNAWVYVDAVNGTTIPAAGMVATTLAGAKAVAPTARARDVSTAARAIYNTARALVAANGGAAASLSLDGCRIVLAPGTHAGVGTSGMGTGATSTEIPLLVMGDPEDSNPRANCILQTGTATNLRITRLRLRGLRLQCGTTGLVSSTTNRAWLDDCTVEGKAGQETNTGPPLPSGIFAAGQWNLCITGSKISRTGWVTNNGNSKVGLARANQHSRALGTMCAVKNRFIPATEDMTVTSQVNCYQMSSDTADLGAMEDIVVAYNDARGCAGIFLQLQVAPAAIAGTLLDSARRHLILGNVAERIGNTLNNFAGYGEGVLWTMSHIVHEGNSFVGERLNAYYSDPYSTTIADTNTLYNEAFVIRMANNFHDRQPSKQDDFNDGRSAALRGTADGYRPQMVHAWGPHYGVGYEGNFEAGRTTSLTIAQHEYFGLRSVGADIVREPYFTDDRSLLGSGGGLGDYTPLAISPLLGRVVRGSSDRDWAGNARLPNGAAGAIERAAGAAPSSLAPAGARSGQAAAPVLVGVGYVLAPAASWLGTSCGIASVSAIGQGTALDPDVSTLQLLPAPALLLPDGALAALHTLLVRAEPRTLFVT